MSTFGYGPPLAIDGPPPVRPLYGLLQAAAAPAAAVRVVPDDDAGVPRWANGVEVYPYPPGTGETFDACAGGSAIKGYEDEDGDTPRFASFVVVLPVTCPARKVWSPEDFKARALETFTAIEGAAVAHEFLTGERMVSNPHLSDGQGEFPAGDTLTSPPEALALLEAEIARSRRQGLIHMSPQMAIILDDYLRLDREAGVLRTTVGTVVIPDAGYVDGADPDGHGAAGDGEEWIYATGPVDIRRSEVFTNPENVAEALDRGLGASAGRTNQITYRVERYYLVDWDTVVQAAVRVDYDLAV